MTASNAKFLPRFRLGRGNDSWSDNEGGAIALFAFVVVIVLSVLPISQLIMAAGRASPDGSNVLTSLLGDSTVRRATFNTMWVAVGSTAFAMIWGAFVAISLVAMRLRTRRILAFLFVLSLMIAPQVSALAFKTLAGPASPILNTLGIAPPLGTPNPMLGLFGIIFVMGLHHAPLVAITIGAGLARIPASLVEAAALDGATPWQILRRVVLPVARLYFLSAALLAFIAGVGNFGIPALLGLPVGFITLPTLVFRELASFGAGGINQAAAVSLIIAVIAGSAVIVSAWLMNRRDIRMDGGALLQPFIHSRAIIVSVEVLLWIAFCVTILLPLLSLLATALVPAYGVTLSWETLTFGQFFEVLFRQQLVRSAFANSLVYAGSAAIVLAIMAVLLAYVIDRRLAKLRAIVLSAVEMPYALPGVVVAIACILLFVNPLPLTELSLYGTAWIIIFAYMASFLAIALKPVISAMASLDREVEEAALIDGASVSQRIAKVILPLTLPSVVAGGVMVFLLAFNELTISALLWSAGSQTLGVALLNLEDAGLGAESAALAVTATVIVALLMLLLEWAGKMIPHDALPWRSFSEEV